jgi:putative tricarboxylic transport membrane protein
MASILLGAILGPMAEAGFRRAMLIGHGDLTIFLTRPLSLALVILTFASIYAGWRMQKQTRTVEAEIAAKIKCNTNGD